MTKYEIAQSQQLWALVVCIAGLTGCGESLPGGPTTPVALSEDKILLIQYEGRYSAIKLSGHEDGSATAYWWHQMEPGTHFRSKTVISGSIELYENYQVTKRRSSGANIEEQVSSKGSSLLVKYDDIVIEWSKPNWLYVSDDYTHRLVDAQPIDGLELCE